MIVVFITVKLKKLILIIAVLVVLIAAIIVLLVGCGKSDSAETAVLGNTTATLVIDPGHGGDRRRCGVGKRREGKRHKPCDLR